jgi:hypothetical protein
MERWLLTGGGCVADGGAGVQQADAAAVCRICSSERSVESVRSCLGDIRVVIGHLLEVDPIAVADSSDTLFDESAFDESAHLHHTTGRTWEVEALAWNSQGLPPRCTGCPIRAPSRR